MTKAAPKPYNLGGGSAIPSRQPGMQPMPSASDEQQRGMQPHRLGAAALMAANSGHAENLPRPLELSFATEMQCWSECWTSLKTSLTPISTALKNKEGQNSFQVFAPLDAPRSCLTKLLT
eukprot:CAMPEP_0177406358 /NCGR_PEP_ID=MMETSP0368-20130122/62522_1 /TAXON_ID=447022 ORGANISM="Scrippsiella hangoei-like, Strain SHHI-4" /NCGR_SAMPLE_ID=MMETSP0368 /ASSEMBLY_ACC=CAM_ASM_000363 /LENGTH=119 /DNA_ID=CAMNT_0018874763 /DNA_START=183 /DNA_END=541 /DNA_ORIENTATION=-